MDHAGQKQNLLIHSWQIELHKRAHLDLSNLRSSILLWRCCGWSHKSRWFDSGSRRKADSNRFFRKRNLKSRWVCRRPIVSNVWRAWYIAQITEIQAIGCICYFAHHNERPLPVCIVGFLFWLGKLYWKNRLCFIVLIRSCVERPWRSFRFQSLWHR